jgi:hypothetical protein
VRNGNVKRTECLSSRGISSLIVKFSVSACRKSSDLSRCINVNKVYCLSSLHDG